MLAAMPEANLHVYVVWLPVLARMSPEALTGASRSAARRLADPRVRHFVDSEARLGELYAPILRLPEGAVAWDVYFLFRPEGRWEKAPPAPDFWMHQLFVASPEQRLEARRFAAEVEKLLVAVKK
ncbi:MAG: hypothetical protein HYY26_00705 [Acidobacteria bacterium]|nr:hypothetical protein [Acidobacteriota bacterium]